MAFLNKDGNVVTSARNDGTGKPITDVFMKGGGSDVQDITLQNGATATGIGTSFNVGYFKTLNIKITGTNTSRTIVFEAAGFDNVFEPIQGVRPKDYIMDSKTTENNESWQFDVTGFSSFRTRIEAIAGGNVTIKGRAVS